MQQLLAQYGFDKMITQIDYQGKVFILEFFSMQIMLLPSSTYEGYPYNLVLCCVDFKLFSAFVSLDVDCFTCQEYIDQIIGQLPKTVVLKFACNITFSFFNSLFTQKPINCIICLSFQS